MPNPIRWKILAGRGHGARLSIRWGKLGSNGTLKRIPLAKCQDQNPVLELKNRSCGKLAKGYDLIPHETVLP
ncbi:hypothetical protein LJC36_02445 [Desulfovibrio sp. OttesenSCG-928-C14]|nr:hypothetical protein [Desulfovibrio sp. OttesenSCG-928-C14]